MLVKYAIQTLVFYLCLNQANAQDGRTAQSEQMNIVLDNFEIKINKLIHNLNSSYVNLKPEEIFASHIIKKATLEILQDLQLNIAHGIHEITENNEDHINFAHCINDETKVNEAMALFISCNENETEHEMSYIKNEYITVIEMTSQRLTDVRMKFKACESNNFPKNCFEELDSISENYYLESLKQINAVNKLIMFKYRNFIKHMPKCATQAIHFVIDIPDIFRCLILAQKHN